MTTNPEKRVFFFDESRFGTHSNIGHGWFRKGSRTLVKVKLGFQNFYLYSAVDPKCGNDFTLMLPRVNTDCLNLFLSEMSEAFAGQQIIIVMDGAGWHKSQDLVIPSNIEIMYLPPYSPELNPVERLWLYIKSHTIKNAVYDTIEILEDAISDFIVQHVNPELLKTVCNVNYV